MNMYARHAATPIDRVTAAHQRDQRETVRGERTGGEQSEGEEGVDPPVRPGEPPLPHAEPAAYGPAGGPAELVERPAERPELVEGGDQEEGRDEDDQNEYEEGVWSSRTSDVGAIGFTSAETAHGSTETRGEACEGREQGECRADGGRSGLSGRAG